MGSSLWESSLCVFLLYSHSSSSVKATMQGMLMEFDELFPVMGHSLNSSKTGTMTKAPGHAGNGLQCRSAESENDFREVGALAVVCQQSARA